MSWLIKNKKGGFVTPSDKTDPYTNDYKKARKFKSYNDAVGYCVFGTESVVYYDDILEMIRPYSFDS